MASENNFGESLLSGISDANVRDALGYRENFRAFGALDAPMAEIEASEVPLSWRDAISQTAYDFIVRWETGGKAYYEQVIKSHPVWPGLSSGITIGCGFDLGYHTSAETRAQWGTRLPAGDLAQLLGAIGFKTTEPDRAQKVTRAKELVLSFKDIVVPWAVALEQFENAKLPDLVHQLYNALSNLDLLHAHCRGALLSLTFNRGPSFRASGERYQEMRAINDKMNAGTREAFEEIPSLLRQMKRIWGEQSSLAQRREGEAELFEQGLAAS